MDAHRLGARLVRGQQLSMRAPDNPAFDLRH
jgi:hypothetical protein